MNTLKLKNSIFKIFIELFIWNKKTRSKMKANWTKWHLRKYVDFAVRNTSIEQSNATVSDEKPIIWQYWHQGIENAPELMQKCVKSVKIHHPDCDVRVLSFDTIKNYVEIPQRFYDLLEQKRISIAIFSDILRLYLLKNYGGTWIDSTLYFTDRIPQEIFDSEFFVLQKNPETDAFGDKMSCYFIRAKKNNYFTRLILNTLEKYWAENSYLIHYFMFEHVVSMLSEANDNLKEYWEKMYFMSTDKLGLLRRRLYADFDEVEYNAIKNEVFLHKLSYKILQEGSSGKSFYDKIIG
ncbi:MAG: hypothetical protein IJW31_01900 [Lentisphaeria bacterium]|nr:hypothetical protein [Lentisphaeria bacterium]